MKEDTWAASWRAAASGSDAETIALMTATPSSALPFSGETLPCSRKGVLRALMPPVCQLCVEVLELTNRDRLQPAAGYDVEDLARPARAQHDLLADVLRLGAPHGADADIVEHALGQLQRRLGLGARAHRQAEHRVVAQQPPRARRVHVVLPDVHARHARRQRNVHPVVHKHRHAVAVAQRLGAPRDLHKLARLRRLLPHLH